MKNDFYCNSCDEDIEGIECIEKHNRWVRWYEARCGCGQKLIRYITNPRIDPYFYKSKKVQKMRAIYADDIIQPDDPRFKKHYKEQAEKLDFSADRVITQQKKKTEEDRAKNTKIIKKYGEEAKRVLKQIGEDV